MEWSGIGMFGASRRASGSFFLLEDVERDALTRLALHALGQAANPFGLDEGRASRVAHVTRAFDAK